MREVLQLKHYTLLMGQATALPVQKKPNDDLLWLENLEPAIFQRPPFMK